MSFEEMGSGVGGILLDQKNKTSKWLGKTPADTNKSIGLRASYVMSQKCFWCHGLTISLVLNAVPINVQETPGDPKLRLGCLYIIIILNKYTLKTTSVCLILRNYRVRIWRIKWYN